MCSEGASFPGSVSGSLEASYPVTTPPAHSLEHQLVPPLLGAQRGVGLLADGPPSSDDEEMIFAAQVRFPGMVGWQKGLVNLCSNLWQKYHLKPGTLE